MSRTVNSIHDFTKGESVSFGRQTELNYKMCSPNYNGHPGHGISTFNNGWRVKEVASHNNEWHLYLGGGEDSSMLFMIPESELIAKGIIKPEPSEYEKMRYTYKDLKELRGEPIVHTKKGLTQEEFERIANSVDIISKRSALAEHTKQSLSPDVTMDKEEDMLKQEYKPKQLQDMKDRWKGKDYTFLIDERYYAPENTKPPLGLKPRFLVVEERIKDIIAAIERVNTANEIIPHEWIDELIELNNWKKQNSK